MNIYEMYEKAVEDMKMKEVIFIFADDKSKELAGMEYSLSVAKVTTLARTIKELN